MKPRDDIYAVVDGTNKVALYSGNGTKVHGFNVMKTNSDDEILLAVVQHDKVRITIRNSKNNRQYIMLYTINGSKIRKIT